QKVRFTGFVAERHVVLSLYRRADLLVFPSVYDNAPMVVREAAAMGTPALLLAESCAAEGIVHGENGFLCRNTVESIAEGIRSAIPSAQAVGARARETIPIPWEQLMRDVLARYQKLIDSKRERSNP
ncbi:MAG: glycosyltransferase, partial [Clostridia bacterium]